MLPLRIGEEAEAELAEAARWYESHRSGLGIDFLEAVDEAVIRIAEMPRLARRSRALRMRRFVGERCAASHIT